MFFIGTFSIVNITPELCIRCRGTKYLCGLTYCPLMVRLSISKVNTTEVYGSSPPSVFVGRFNYPKVNIYPATPPIRGDTKNFEDPKFWMKIDLNEFLRLRLSIVRGGEKVDVNKAQDPDRFLLDIQSIALSLKPADIDLKLVKPPRGGEVNDDTPPLGPSAPLRKLEIVHLQPPPKVAENVYQDTDLKAVEAVITLYKSSIDVEDIAKLLSVGTLGVRRRLVPTRWSITAVDTMISNYLVEKIKQYDTIDKVEVYVREFKKNLFIAILLPQKWSFEWGEAWFPGSTWNKFGNDVGVEVDYEGYYGRKDYPEIGGCYYASRVGVAEYLERRKRQATAILWREIYSGFDLPIGVWFVRENIRDLFKIKPITFDTLDQALDYLKGMLKVNINRWISKSGLVKRTTIDKWLR